MWIGDNVDLGQGGFGTRGFGTRGFGTKGDGFGIKVDLGQRGFGTKVFGDKGDWGQKGIRDYGDWGLETLKPFRLFERNSHIWGPFGSCFQNKDKVYYECSGWKEKI